MLTSLTSVWWRSMERDAHLWNIFKFTLISENVSLPLTSNVKEMADHQRAIMVFVMDNDLVKMHTLTLRTHSIWLCVCNWRRNAMWVRVASAWGGMCESERECAVRQVAVNTSARAMCRAEAARGRIHANQHKHTPPTVRTKNPSYSATETARVFPLTNVK